MIKQDIGVVRGHREANSIWGWTLWGVWSALLGVSVAILVNTVVYGRVPIEQLLRGWPRSLTLMSVSLVVLAWWMAYGVLLRWRGASLRVSFAMLPALPLVLGVALPVVTIYLSDVANHYFYYTMVDMNRPRGLTVLLLVLLVTFTVQAIQVELVKGVSTVEAFRRVIAQVRDHHILVLLAALGALQTSSYLAHPGMDFLRYWSIADAMAQGVPYPAMPSGSEFVRGGLSSYLIDLPLFPGLLAVSFTLLGHTVAASYVPMVVSNVVLPPLTYLLYRDVLENRVLALSLTALIVLFPPMRFYTLNHTVPDATFLAILTLYCCLFVRIMKGEPGWPTWVAFGFTAGATALARPEGAAYAGIYLLAALWMDAGVWRRASAAALFVALVAPFSLVMQTTFGMPWPRNWVGSLGIDNIVLNWEVLTADWNHYFASSLRMTTSELMLYAGLSLLLALMGSFPGLYRPRRLCLLMAPAWLNLLSVLMVHPLVSGARLWFDFFRHVSYPLPLLLLAAGLVCHAGVRALRKQALYIAGLVTLNVFLFMGVLWDVHFLTKPSLNFGADAGNLLGEWRVNLVDIVLNPFELPVFGFDSIDGYYIPVSPAEFISAYPDQTNAHLSRFDAVRRTSGTPYQTGSLYLYLAALALAALPTPSTDPDARRGSRECT